VTFVIFDTLFVINVTYTMVFIIYVVYHGMVFSYSTFYYGKFKVVYHGIYYIFNTFILAI